MHCVSSIAPYQTIHSSQELQGLTTTQSIQSDSHSTSEKPEVRLHKVVNISWTSQNYLHTHSPVTEEGKEGRESGMEGETKGERERERDGRKIRKKGRRGG